MSETAGIIRDLIGSTSPEEGIRIALMLPAAYLVIRLVLRLLRVLLIAGAVGSGAYMYVALASP